METTEYKPYGKTAVILDRAYEMVKLAPYKVSTRWVFYRLLQDGFYSKKDDYNKWITLSSRARHAFYQDWRPDTLADETREIITRNDGFRTEKEWVEAVASGLYCHLDKMLGQEYYTQLWFEARAMVDQFKHYTQHIDLVPMGGQPSINHKWNIAKSLEIAKEKYDLPLVVLYFGDLDKGGKNIANAVLNDVTDWCKYEFDFINCGLNIEQVKRYNVPENFEKPGDYQWEALDDTAAKEIIENATKPFLHHDAFFQISRAEYAATQKMQIELQVIAENWN